MPKTSNEDILLGLADVAALVGIKPKSAQHLRYAHRLPEADRIFGRSPAWKRSTITKWAEQTGRTIRFVTAERVG